MPSGGKIPVPRVIESALDRGEFGWYYTVGGKGLVEIDPRQSDSEYLDTLIHETLHHLFPKRREDWIIRRSRCLSKVLWRAGYRRNRKSR